MIYETYLWGGCKLDSNNINVLSNKTNLEYLDISNCRKTDSAEGLDISALTNLNKLIWLNMCDNGVTSIAALANKPNLDTLYIDNNSITDLSPISGSTWLYILGIGGNSINDYSVLSSLTNLQNIYIDPSQESYVAPYTTAVLDIIY